MRKLALAIAVVVTAAACGATARNTRPTTGSVTGTARDHDSGEPVPKAEPRLRAANPGQLSAPTLVVADAHGAFTFDHVAPGTYSVNALYAGQPIEIDNIAVHAGIPAVVDIMFTLGRPDAIHTTVNTETIDRYHPRGLAATVGRIEGSVVETATHDRVAGAVVTAIGPGDPTTSPVVQTVTDDNGRFRFDSVAPGNYVVSAYYQVDNHGQMEVRRSDIAVAGGEGVIVPLQVELAR